MTIKELAQALAYVGIWGSAAPVLLGAFRLARRPVDERAAWVWITVAFTLNVGILTIGSKVGTNKDVIDLTRALFAITGMFAISELSGSSRVRSWIYIGLGSYLIFWFWRLVENDFMEGYGAYSGSAMELVLSLAALGMLLDRLRTSRGRILRDFGILFGVGVVISYAPMLAIEGISRLYFESHQLLVWILWITRTVLMIIGILLFSLAFLWTIPRRSSSGLSPSVP